MTKVEAIKKVMQDNNGLANWAIIYNEIEKYYPNAKQPKDWRAGLRGVLYREVYNNRHFKKLDDSLFSLIDYDEINLVLKEDIPITQREIISKIRIGQGKFRKLLLKRGSVCPITKINDKKLLVASHIKPWAFSNDNERLDINNGLILSIMIDKLFDRGFITFSFDKELLVSKSLSKANVGRLNIPHNQVINNLSLAGKSEYLNYHHNKIFLH